MTGGAGSGAGDGGGPGTSSASSGVLFDVGGGADDGGGNTCDPDVDENCGCTAVDILFVVDNSISMIPQQNKLAAAAAPFADAMFSALPPGTSLHVGVTTTEFAHATSGFDGCSPTANSQHYLTPDQQTTPYNGAQGRLSVTNGKAFYEIDTDADAAARQAFVSWLQDAILVGDMGSSTEFSGAAIAWVGEPENEGTNAGFLRDEGAVYAVFVLQDEPDATLVPAEDLLTMLDAQKAKCGGRNCIIGGAITGALGGWQEEPSPYLDGSYCPDVPLFELLDNLGAPPVLEDMPVCLCGPQNPMCPCNDPSFGPSYGDVLADVLTSVIAKKCESIPPVG